MKVRVKKAWNYGATVMEMSDALTPVTSRDGSLEQAQADATLANEVIGRLLAKLVETRVLSIQDACDVAGQYAEIEVIE